MGGVPILPDPPSRCLVGDVGPCQARLGHRQVVLFEGHQTVTRCGDLHYYGAGSTPAPPPPDQTFAMVGAVSGSTSGAPMIVIDGMVPPRLRATLHRRPNLVPVVAELTGAFDRQWQDELNSPGTASMSLGNEDPWATQIQPGDVIRFEDDGWAVFSWIVREIE